MKKIKNVAYSYKSPSAWIVNPKDRGRKSIKKGNKVYLNDGQNFEIELWNPLKDSVLADIRVNGKSISKSGLVILPGQRFYLDCFVDDKKKFVFNTYNVENTSESIEAISDNGKVEVFFYKEDTDILKIKTPVYYPSYPSYYPVYYPIYPPTYNTYCNTKIGSINSDTISTTNDIYSMNVNSNTLNTNLSNITYTSNSYYSSTNLDINPTSLSDVTKSTNIETGRVGKGEESKQKFEDVDMNFQNYIISHISYQILPESQRPIKTDEIKRKFCSECGTKFKGTEKFCPQCGIKL